MRPWMNLDDRHSPCVIARYWPKRRSWMSPSRDGAIGIPEECAVRHAEVSSAIPIRYTGIC